MHTIDIKEHAMRLAPVLAFLALGLLSACAPAGIGRDQAAVLVTAQAPLSSGYPLSTQPKMQALAHWDQLAANVAKNCAKALEHFHPEGDVRVYVAPLEATPFGKSYRESLLTRLVDYGVPISFSPDGAAVLEVSLELVSHHRTIERTRTGRRYAVEPGFVQRKDPQGLYAPVPVISEESGFFDAPAPETEVQVNSALIHRGGYLYRDSSIFYVDARDRAHYQLGVPKDGVELRRYSVVDK